MYIACCVKLLQLVRDSYYIGLALFQSDVTVCLWLLSPFTLHSASLVDYDVYSLTIGFPLFFVCCYSTLPAIVSIPVKSSRTSGDPALAWAGNMLSWGKCGLRLGRLEPPMF